MRYKNVKLHALPAGDGVDRRDFTFSWMESKGEEPECKTVPLGLLSTRLTAQDLRRMRPTRSLFYIKSFC
jgi:hypothetical protein